MGFAKRVDDNHREVVDEFRATMKEATLFDLSGAGGGITDCIVGWRGMNFLFEIKDPSKSPSRRKLTPAQIKFHGEWQGQKSVVLSAAEMCAEIAREMQKRR